MTKQFNWRAHLQVHPAADLFPLMSEPELKELAEDIRKNGLQHPVVTAYMPCDGQDRYNRRAYLIDGRNRLDALALLGWLKPHSENSKLLGGMGPFVIRKRSDTISVNPAHLPKQWESKRHVAGDEAVYRYVVAANIQRRHLTTQQKRELVAKLLKANPEQSNRKVAKQVKVDHKTVAAVRRNKEATGEIPQLKKTVGVDGKARKKAIHWQRRVHPDVAYEAERNGVTARTVLQIDKTNALDENNAPPPGDSPRAEKKRNIADPDEVKARKPTGESILDKFRDPWKRAQRLGFCLQEGYGKYKFLLSRDFAPYTGHARGFTTLPALEAELDRLEGMTDRNLVEYWRPFDYPSETVTPSERTEP